MALDPRAVVAGTTAAIAYLAVLALLPGLERVGLAGVPLVLATGLVAGATAGLIANDGPATGAWHGLIAGSLAGGAFAVALVAVFSLNEPYGVFHGLNYVVALSAGDFPVVATHSRVVVPGLAGGGWALIALLGVYAGHAAPRRDGGALIEG